MNQNYLPPLLRGIGTTIVLVATVFSVIVARDNLRAEQGKRDAVRAKAGADVKTRPVGTWNPAEFMAKFQELQSEEDDSVIDEVMDNPWFNYAGFLGMTTIASSFFMEAFQRRREKT